MLYKVMTEQLQEANSWTANRAISVDDLMPSKLVPLCSIISSSSTERMLTLVVGMLTARNDAIFVPLSGGKAR